MEAMCIQAASALPAANRSDDIAKGCSKNIREATALLLPLQNTSKHKAGNLLPMTRVTKLK